MASPTQWTWVWASSRSRWWIGRPGVMQSMGSQIVRLDWVTELNWDVRCFPAGSEGKNPVANAGDGDSISESGRAPGEGNDNLLQYSCLGNPMDRGASWSIGSHGVATDTEPFIHRVCNSSHDTAQAVPFLTAQELDEPSVFRLQTFLDSEESSQVQLWPFSRLLFFSASGTWLDILLYLLSPPYFPLLHLPLYCSALSAEIFLVLFLPGPLLKGCITISSWISLLDVSMLNHIFKLWAFFSGLEFWSFT